MKKTFLIFLLAFLACFANAQMPVFRNQFTTNVPGAYVRGNSTFGTGGTGTYTFNGQLLTYVDALGGVDFMVSTNIYGTGTPLFIIRNGTAGFNMDSQGSYSVSASSYWAQRYTADQYMFSPSYWLGSVNGLPRMAIFGGGAGFYPQTGTTNWMVWLDTNAAPVSVVNSNGWFGILTNTPTAALEVHGQVKATNFLQTIPSWDDVRIALSTLSNPSAQPDKINPCGGLTVYGFDDGTTEQLDFELQFPHGIDTNNAYGLRLHIHWSGSTAVTPPNSNVVWGIEYTWANPFQGFPTLTITNRITNGLIAANSHMIAPLVTITNVKESGVLVGRLFREGGNGGDTYVGDACGLSLDAHYPRIKLGSDAEFGDY